MPLRLSLGLLLCISSSAALAQSNSAYPTHAARMIVPWTAGGTADLMARIASHKFSESFGQQFVVDNRPGTGGLIGTTAPNSVAPAATPKEVIAKLNGELVRALEMPDIKERISSLGAEVVSTTPEGLDQFNRAQIALWGKVVKASGARVE